MEKLEEGMVKTGISVIVDDLLYELYGAYGSVIETKDGKAAIQLDQDCCTRFHLEDKNGIIVVPIDKLSIYSRLLLLEYRFAPENTCMINGCTHKSQRRIWYTVGSLTLECDACEEHVKACASKVFDKNIVTPHYRPEKQEALY